MVVSAVFARKGELTDDLPPDMRARLVRISELIESVGLPNVKEPHLRQCRCRPTVKTPHRSWRDRHHDYHLQLLAASPEGRAAARHSCYEAPASLGAKQRVSGQRRCTALDVSVVRA